MKKALLITLLVLLCTSILVSCGEETTSPSNNTPTATKPNENVVRYTITEDEWNKTLAMNNYTVTLEIPTQPEVTQIERVTKNAIQRDMGYSDYYVNENGSFYRVYEEELCYIYSFKNGVIDKIEIYSITTDTTGFWHITDIGTTVVSVPEYIPLSAIHALEVMPNGGGFEEIDISTYSLPISVKEAHRAINGGYVIIVEFSGFNPGNKAVIGIDANGKVVGTKILQCNDNYSDQLEKLDANGHFNGADCDTIDGVDTVSRATVSTKAYRNAVKDALNAVKIITNN